MNFLELTDRLRRSTRVRAVLLGITAAASVLFLAQRLGSRRQWESDTPGTVRRPDANEYWIHPALGDDFNAGVVWIRQSSLGKFLDGERRIVRIRTGTGGRSIHCEALWADSRYLERWIENLESRMKLLRTAPMHATEGANELASEIRRFDAFRSALWEYRVGVVTEPPLVFIGGWHRRRLNIKLRREFRADALYNRYSLAINTGKWPWSIVWQFRAGVEHPQTVVALATALAVIGLGFGFVGAGLGLIAIPYEGLDHAMKLQGLWNALRLSGIVLIPVGAVILTLGFLPLLRRALVISFPQASSKSAD
jgi:hypothetical protein